mmetsp:Transcript_26078/g.39469  ORF Transcript_26078/g.39469 Transcript_26078/m.39469 type:complete len:98 (-) Transcript_26078:588-881(-)
MYFELGLALLAEAIAHSRFKSSIMKSLNSTFGHFLPRKYVEIHKTPMSCCCQDDHNVPYFMKAKTPWDRVWFFRGVHNAPDSVQNPTKDKDAHTLFS